MGPFLLLHVALIGVFACAALYSIWTWWLSRHERTLLIFAMQCVLCAALTISYVALAAAQTPAAAERALSGRLIFGLTTIAVTAALIARLTGVRARDYVRAVSLFAVVVSAVHLLLGPSRGDLLSLRPFTFPWGETISIPQWYPAPWWFTPTYGVVLSVNVFGLVGAARMTRRDRFGAALIALAMGTGLIAATAGYVADVHHVPVPYVGSIPFAFWVIFTALQLSREYAQMTVGRLASEQQFRSLFEGLDVGVVLQDAQDRRLASNPAAARMLGLSDAELGGMSSRDPRWGFVREDGTDFPLDDLPSVAALRTRQPVHDAVVGATNRLTGERMWVQVTALPRLNADGTPLHVIITMTDVTHRKQVEEALRTSERRLALAISATSDAVWEWNCRTGAAYYSPRWFEMLGHSPSMPMAIDTWKSLCHPDDLPTTLALIEATLESRQANGYEVEYRMRRADGTWLWVLGRGNVVERDDDGRPVLLAGTSTDISARKEAEAKRRELESQLAQSQRMESMGRLAGGIAHDFNNLLTVINGYSDLLLTTGRFNEPTREMLTDIRSAGDRAASLTKQLLTFSRHQVVVPDIVDLNAVVSDTERMLQRLIGEHITLETDLHADPLWVRADTGQLGQVIVNLAVNARDAMQNGGTLTVSTAHAEPDDEACRTLNPTARPGRYAILSVRDTGTGIPPELHGVVFEPFFTTKPTGQGTGLGLATVHGIAQQCHGFLTVTSAPGAGSLFSLYLPETEAPPYADMDIHEPAQSVHGQRTILMAEDDEAVRPVVQSMLQHLGFNVLAATGGRDALRVVARHAGPIDLLLTDVIMPDMSGPELAVRVERLRPGIPVLYMSGYTNDALVRELVTHADAQYLQKPFDADALAKKVKQTIDGGPPAAGM